MDMPCNCSGCGDLVDLNDLFFPNVYYGDKYSNDYGLCLLCFQDVEEEEEK